MYAYGSREDRLLHPWRYPREPQGVAGLSDAVGSLGALAIWAGIVVLAGVGAYVLLKKR
jgi:hypothetical protein